MIFARIFVYGTKFKIEKINLEKQVTTGGYKKIEQKQKERLKIESKRNEGNWFFFYFFHRPTKSSKNGTNNVFNKMVQSLTGVFMY
jgi:hypothetical protein